MEEKIWSRTRRRREEGGGERRARSDRESRRLIKGYSLGLIVEAITPLTPLMMNAREEGGWRVSLFDLGECQKMCNEPSRPEKKKSDVINCYDDVIHFSFKFQRILYLQVAFYRRLLFNNIKLSVHIILRPLTISNLSTSHSDSRSAGELECWSVGLLSPPCRLSGL
jgi:hypothetical protein